MSDQVTSNWVPVLPANEEVMGLFIALESNDRLRKWLFGQLEQLSTDDVHINTEIAKRGPAMGIPRDTRFGVNLCTARILVHPDDVATCGLTPLSEADAQAAPSHATGEDFAPYEPDADDLAWAAERVATYRAKEATDGG
jgi:hypothetical protein